MAASRSPSSATFLADLAPGPDPGSTWRETTASAPNIWPTTSNARGPPPALSGGRAPDDGSTRASPWNDFPQAELRWSARHLDKAMGEVLSDRVSGDAVSASWSVSSSPIAKIGLTPPGEATVLEPQARPGCLPRPFAKVRTLHGTLDARRRAIRGQPRIGRARKKDALNLAFFGGDGGI